MSLRDRILAAKDYRSELVEIPEWEATVEVRELDGMTRARLAAQVGDEANPERLTVVYPMLLGSSLYDPTTGDRLFDTEEDVAALMGKSGAVLDRLAIVALRVSGMTEDAVDVAGRSLPR